VYCLPKLEEYNKIRKFDFKTVKTYNL